MIIIKEVELNNKVYVVEIDEVNENHFWSRNIAIAKAYAKVEKLNYYSLLERLAMSVKNSEMNNTDLDLMNLFGKAFYGL